MRKLTVLFLFFILVSCGGETLPKPKAFLSLQYKKAVYTKLILQRPYSFEVPKNATIKDEPKNWLKIEYPELKASLDITYRKIEGNLRELIQESEKLVVKHTVKAETISSNNYIDETKKVYGTLNEITGNAASQIQFHITDSTKNFIKGALYFRTKPNYDSVLPAVSHIKKDILHLMETLEWKE
ncbi:gliding motility lipoprotein GldD [Pseudotenacibaculum sp. MALMAid0570]|uniref:gliding motility lipoprotein GldD n=1 Tax=Pseudotenacibaculum sp. MALMAid0570 TaxID=3143938 RepID=UPI0032DFD3FA